MRVVGVGRVSSRKASQDTSIETQEVQLREIATRRGWDWVGWFADRASGKSLDRPGLNGALDLLFRDRADILLVHNLDRLGRNAGEMLATVDALAAAGKKLYSRDEEIDATGAMGRYVFIVFAGLAEYYRRRASEGILLGLERARQRGRIGGRRRTLDYSKLPEVQQLRAQGLSWTKVAAKVGGPKSGKAWGLALKRHGHKTPPKNEVQKGQNPGPAGGPPATTPTR